MTRGPATLGALLERFGITAPPDLPEDTARPWLVMVVASFGAALAGAALMIAIGTAWMALDLDEETGTILGGLLALGAGILLARADGSVFVRQFAVTAGIAGHVLLTGAGYLVSETVTGAAVAAAVVAAASWPLLRDGTYHFLSAAIALTVANIALMEVHGSGQIGLTMVAVPVALWALLHPPAGADLRPTALAVFLTPLPFLGILDDHALQVVDSLPYAVGIAWLSLPLLTGHAGRIAVTAAGTLALAALLPGAAAAVAILALAWRLGSRALADVGIAALLAFVAHFYYALHLTLLAKAGLLLAGGTVTLGLWALSRRRRIAP